MARKTGLVIRSTAVDEASPKIRELTNKIVSDAARIAAADANQGKAAQEAAKKRDALITATQKTKFAMKEQAAAGNVAALASIKMEKRHAALTAQMRRLAKAGEPIPATLAREANEAKRVTDDFKRLEKESKKTGDTTETMGTKMRGAAGSLAKIAGGAAAAGAAMAAASFALAKGTAEFGDNTIKSAQRLGVSVEEYQRLDHAMQISGTTMDSQKGAMGRLFKGMMDASQGIGEGKKAFDALGISVANNDGTLKGTTAVLGEVSDKFKDLPRGPEKAALAMQIFGRSGSEMTQFLELGSEGMADLGDEAESLGVVMSTGAAQASERFVDSMTRVNAGAKGLKDSIGVSLMGAFNVFTDSMIDNGKVSDATMQNIRSAIAATIQVFGSIISVGLELGLRLGNVFRGVVVVANTMLWGVAGVVDLAVKAILTVFDPLKLLFDGVVALGLMSFNPIEAGISMITDVTENMRDTFKDSAADMAQDMADAELATRSQVLAFDNMVNRAADAANTIQTAVLPAQRNQKTITAETTAEIVKQTAATDAGSRAAEKAAKLKDKKISETRKLEAKAAADKEREQLALFGKITGVSSNMFQSLGANLNDAAKAWGGFAKAGITAVVQMAQQQIVAYAASASAAAFFSQAGIPIVGPFLAVAAAGAASGLILGLLSTFNKGGIVGGQGSRDSIPALLTPGEAVLPKGLTSMLLSAAGVGRPGGRGADQGRQVQSSGGGGVTVNIIDRSLSPRTPGQLDQFVRNELLPSLKRLQRRGVAV